MPLNEVLSPFELTPLLLLFLLNCCLGLQLLQEPIWTHLNRLRAQKSRSECFGRQESRGFELWQIAVRGRRREREFGVRRAPAPVWRVKRGRTEEGVWGRSFGFWIERFGLWIQIPGGLAQIALEKQELAKKAEKMQELVLMVCFASIVLTSSAMEGRTKLDTPVHWCWLDHRQLPNCTWVTAGTLRTLLSQYHEQQKKKLQLWTWIKFNY